MKNNKLTFEQECKLIANGEDLLKEKQIEEITKDLKENLRLCAGVKLLDHQVETIAYELSRKYQPKLPKGSVVLSGEQCVEIVQDNYNIGYERGSKEMAEKIINPLLDVEVIDEDYKQFFLDVCGKLEELADKHGVEIKEQ